MKAQILQSAMTLRVLKTFWFVNEVQFLMAQEDSLKFKPVLSPKILTLHVQGHEFSTESSTKMNPYAVSKEEKQFYNRNFILFPDS